MSLSKWIDPCALLRISYIIQKNTLSLHCGRSLDRVGSFRFCTYSILHQESLINHRATQRGVAQCRYHPCYRSYLLQGPDWNSAWKCLPSQSFKLRWVLTWGSAYKLSRHEQSMAPVPNSTYDLNPGRACFGTAFSWLPSRNWHAYHVSIRYIRCLKADEHLRHFQQLLRGAQSTDTGLRSRTILSWPTRLLC